MKFNYRLIFVNVVLIIFHFPTTSAEELLISETSAHQPIEVLSNQSIHEESPESPAILSPVTLPVTAEFNSTAEKVQVSISSIRADPLDLNRPATLPVEHHGDKNVSVNHPVPLPASTEHGVSSIPSLPSPVPATLPSLDHPNIQIESLPSTPDMVGPLVAPSLPLVHSEAKAESLSVDLLNHSEPALPIPAADKRPEISEEPPLSLPVPFVPSDDKSSVLPEKSNKTTGNISEPVFETHEMIIAEILKKPPNGDEGPIILRPHEIAQVEPIYIPAPVQTSPIVCPHCGQRQIWERKEPCTHCAFCGHNIAPENLRTGNPIQEGTLPSQLRKLRKSNSGLKSSNFRAESQQVHLVPIHADVKLNRRELMRRRLNYQRVSQYMKSIAPDKETRNVKPDIITRGEPLQKKLKVEETKTTQNGTEDSTSTGGFSFTSFTSWLTGRGRNEPPRVLTNSQPLRPSTRAYKCPYAKY